VLLLKGRESRGWKVDGWGREGKGREGEVIEGEGKWYPHFLEKVTPLFVQVH